MKYGYARVSKDKQNLDRQLDSLQSHSIDINNIFVDKYTGTKIDRKGYMKLKSVLSRGDELYIHELDRLGRNKELIKNEVKWFRDNGIILRILNIPTTLMELEGQEWLLEMINNIVLEILSSLAQQERDNIVNRTVEGLASAKKRGVKLGRKCTDRDKIVNVQELLDNGYSISNACATVGISRKTWYNAIRR